MILKKQSYKTEILNKRFAHAYFKDKALPSGNVLVFAGEFDPGAGYDFSQYSIDYMEEALHLVYENPLIQDAVSGALFSHFMVSSIANVLSQEFLKMPLSVNMDTIIINKEFKRKGIIQQQGILNISRFRIVSSACLGHIALCNKAGEKSAIYTYEMGLNEDDLEKLSKTFVDMYYRTTDAVFLRSIAC